MKRVLLLTIAMVAAFGLSGCSYNELTAKQQNVRTKWANVESALQRRADLHAAGKEARTGDRHHEVADGAGSLTDERKLQCRITRIIRRCRERARTALQGEEAGIKADVAAGVEPDA